MRFVNEWVLNAAISFQSYGVAEEGHRDLCDYATARALGFCGVSCACKSRFGWHRHLGTYVIGELSNEAVQCQ